MDMLFNPSVTETFGNVTLEAMAAGLPVVAASATGSQSLVADGVTGRLIRPGAIDLFADALRRILHRRGGARARPARRAARPASATAGTRSTSELVDSYLRIIRQHNEGGRQRRSPVP